MFEGWSILWRDVCAIKTIGQAKLTHNELITAVVEIEAILNSWPLSYMSSNDLEEFLTPSHQIVEWRLLSLPDTIRHVPDKDTEAHPEVLTRRMKHFNYCLTRFWTYWRREYLTELREAHRSHHGCGNLSKVTQGDIVVIHSTDHPRGFWKFGCVIKFLLGRDSLVRGAVLCVDGEGRQVKLVENPMSLLYPLETCIVENCQETTGTVTDTSLTDTTTSQDFHKRPRHAAQYRYFHFLL